MRDVQEGQRRQAIFAKAGTDYRQLESDASALAEYLAEISVWEVMFSDGLEPEDWFMDAD